MSSYLSCSELFELRVKVYLNDMVSKNLIKHVFTHSIAVFFTIDKANKAKLKDRDSRTGQLRSI